MTTTTLKPLAAAPMLDYPSGPRGVLPTRPWAVAGMAATVPLVTMLMGALTNAVDGAVSPRYFVVVVGWERVQNVWAAAVAQGILEGALYGVAFSLMFTVAVTAITRARCPYRLALRTVLLLAGVALACWVMGGLLGITLATISPEMYRQTFVPRPGSPAAAAVLSEFRALLAYAWVGGSIWGVLIGGLAAVVVSLPWFHHHWRQLHGPGRERRAVYDE